MAVKVVGKRVGSFNDKQTGQAVNFGKIYVTYEDAEMSGLTGLVAEAISVKPEIAQEIPVNSFVTLVYNRYGKVESVKVETQQKTA